MGVIAGVNLYLGKLLKMMLIAVKVMLQIDFTAETSTGSEFLSFLRISEFFRFI